MHDATKALLGIGGLGLAIAVLGSKPKRRTSSKARTRPQTMTFAVGERALPHAFALGGLCSSSDEELARNTELIVRDLIAPAWHAIAPRGRGDAHVGQTITAVASRIARRCPPDQRLRAVARVKQIAESAWRTGVLR